MRKAINSNPMVQMGILGVLGVLIAVFFMSGSGVESPAPPPDVETATTPAVTTPVTGGVPAETTSPAPEALAPGAAVGGAPFEAGKGLPAEFVDAYESGDVVVLLVMQEKIVEDESIKNDVAKLDGRKDTSVFVVDTKSVAKYSRIAEGVDLKRTPAIIVLSPLDVKLAKGEAAPLPAATVTYGYRGPESVQQKVNDALYEGKQLGYDPG